jgi:hypothetical protein
MFPITTSPTKELFSMSPAPAYSGVWRLLMWVIIWYAIAKVCEHFDKDIYSATGFISGHSLKHIAAGMATWFIIKMFGAKYMLPVER